MKKLLLMSAALLAAASASANWGSYANPLKVFPTGTPVYGHTTYGGTDLVWTVIYEPTKDTDDPEEIQENVYSYMLQGVKGDGSLVFPEGGKLISNYTNLSFTEFNRYVFTDRDNNAIVMARDLRNSDTDAREFSLYLYKVSPEGEMLWGEDGISIDGDNKCTDLTATEMCQLDDGSYVVSYMAPNQGVIYMQRVSNDGQTKYWGEKGIQLSGVYPWLTRSLDNQVILVYINNGVLKAMKYDFDGSEAWPKAIDVYAGGFTGRTPPHAIVRCVSSGDDGGVLVA